MGGIASVRVGERSLGNVAFGYRYSVLIGVTVSGMDGSYEDAVVPVLHARAVVHRTVTGGIGIRPARAQRIGFRIARSGPCRTFDGADGNGYARSGCG